MPRLSGIALCAALALLASCSRKPQGPPPQQALPVMVQTLETQRVPNYTEFIGTIQSRGSSVVQALVEGYLVRIYVHSGQHVAAGAPLMLIDPAKQEAAVQSAQSTTVQQRAQVDLARTNLDRVKQLYAAGVVAKQELDNAQTAYDSAVANERALGANVSQQRTQLRYYTIRAATAGTVGDIPVRVGDHVLTSTQLTTLDTGAGLEDYISIPAERASSIKGGTPVDIVADDNSILHTKITFVSPRVDSTNQLLLVKAAVPSGDPRFRNEQVVHSRIIWGQGEAVLVPVLDVSRQSNAIFAFVVGKNDKGQDVAQQRALQTAGIQGNDYAVTGGVKPGDRLITSGVQLLADGVPVKPMQGPPPGQQNAPTGTTTGSAQGSR